MTPTICAWPSPTVTSTNPARHPHPHRGLGRRHRHLAALPVALLAVAIWWRQREADGTATARRRTYLAPGSATITRVIVAFAVVIAGFAVFDTYRIGDSGAKASWTGDFSPTAAQSGD
ncbi:MAG TPA: hypothetical protein VN408_10505 [Actinoplanes sp.]|nr:hypothetical protein [Actinoplanes sp.]